MDEELLEGMCAGRRRRAAVRAAVIRDGTPVDREVLSLADPEMLSAYLDAFVDERGRRDLDAAIAAGLIHRPAPG